MPTARDLDAVFYAPDVPDIAFRAGMFHVSYRIRNCYFEFVLPPETFNKAMLVAEGARAQWRLSVCDSSNVTPMRRKSKH